MKNSEITRNNILEIKRYIPNSFDQTVMITVLAYISFKASLDGISKAELPKVYAQTISNDPNEELLSKLTPEIERIRMIDASFNHVKEVIAKITEREDIINLIMGQVNNSDRMYQESATPDYINELLVRLADIKPDETVLDPSVGIGGTLVTVLKDNLKQYCVGQELTETSAAIAQIILEIYSADNAKILVGDTLEDPQYIKDGKLEKFDVVLSIPPFGMRTDTESLVNDKYNRFPYGRVPRPRADWAFIMNAISSTNSKGRSIMLLPTGVTFRGASEETIRRNILKDDLFEAIISLPGKMFKSTMIPTTILIFNHNKPTNKKNKIIFISVSEKELEIIDGINHLTSESIEKIVQTEHSFKSIEGYSQVVNIAEVDPSSMRADKYVGNILYEVKSAPYIVKLNDFHKQVETKLLKQIADIDRGYNMISKNETPDGKYKIAKISDIQDGKIVYDNMSRGNVEGRTKIENYEIQENDLLLSVRGTTNKIALAKNVQPNTLINSNMVRIRLHGMDPEFVELFLESPLGLAQLERSSMGTTIKQLPIRNLETIAIPYIPLAEQKKVAATYENEAREIQAQLEILKKESEQNKATVYQAMNLTNLYKKKNNGENNDESR